MLPLYVCWRGHKVYDLDNLQHRKLVYEQVLAEGLDEDVRRFIEVDELVALWEEMMLPSFVRDAWGPWLRQRGLLHWRMLTALQHRLRQLVDEIPEAGNVALAGGGALIVLGVVDRFTTDFSVLWGMSGDRTSGG